MSTFINLSDLFYYWDPYYSRRRAMYTSRPEGMTFFESIFSFGERSASQPQTRRHARLLFPDLLVPQPCKLPACQAPGAADTRALLLSTCLL